MTLSVLWCGGLVHMLWDSDSKSCLLTGSLPEMESWKHRIEEAQQIEANDEHFENLRTEYADMLVKGGNSPEQADIFLRNKMPYLYKT